MSEGGKCVFGFLFQTLYQLQLCYKVQSNCRSTINPYCRNCGSEEAKTKSVSMMGAEYFSAVAQGLSKSGEFLELHSKKKCCGILLQKMYTFSYTH